MSDELSFIPLVNIFSKQVEAAIRTSFEAQNSLSFTLKVTGSSTFGRESLGLLVSELPLVSSFTFIRLGVALNEMKATFLKDHFQSYSTEIIPEKE
jgi:hypothetical protein